MTIPTPVIQLPFTVQNASGYTLGSPSLLTPMFYSLAEPLADGHWLFGTDNPGITDLIAGAAMTPFSTSPTESAGYLTMSGLEGGIYSPFLDATEQTIICTHQKIAYSGLGSTVVSIMGCWDQANSLGQLLYIDSSGYEINTHGANYGKTTVPPPSGAATGAWIFGAVSQSNNATQRQVYWGNGSLTQQVVTKSSAAHDTYLQDNGLFNPAANTLSVAEFIHFSFALSATQLASVYARSKVRLAARGITVY